MSRVLVDVHVGKWIRRVDCVWDLVRRDGYPNKQVDISSVRGFQDLVTLMRESFAIDTSVKTVDLSYMTENEAGDQLCVQPVKLADDCGFMQFLLLLVRRPGTRLNLTVEDRHVVNGYETTNIPVDHLEKETMVSLMRRVESGGYIHNAPSSVLASGTTGHGGHGQTTVDRSRYSTASPIHVSPIPFDLDEELCASPGNEREDGQEEQEAARVFMGGIPSHLLIDPPPQMDYLPRPEDEGLVHVGCVFASKKDLHMALSLMALEHHFCFKVKHSDKTRWYAGCVDPDCGWRVSAKHFVDSDYLEIKKFIPEHTCGAESRSRYVEKATSRVLAQLLNAKYANGKPGPRPCEIPDLVLSDMRVPISYMKAWHTKEVAIAATRGKEEDNFKLLPSYLEQLRNSNPGTLTDVLATVDQSGNHQFLFLFVALGAAISGWPYVRKVVGIDATHLKGKYKGCLVAACCQDGNFQIVPMAIGVVDSENEDSWIWFLENLSKIVTDDDDLVFVSDRHPSISAAIQQVYPRSTHVFCVVHLFRNVKQRYKCAGLASIVNRAARAYTKKDFKYWWTQIENISPECAHYMRDIGFSYWARSYCSGQRYNLMSSNICESFNHAIGKAVDFPIITMVDFVRTLMMKWFNDRRAESSNCRTKCTPNIETLLIQNLKVASDMKTLAADKYVYQVNNTRGLSYTVDLMARSCTCNAFQSLGIPCTHALAAMGANRDDIYTYVDKHYSSANWEKIYSGVIMPVPMPQDCEAGGDVEGVGLLPPNSRRPSGRPKKARVRSSGECLQGGAGKSGRCGRCNEYGHNRKTCKNAI